MLVGGMPFFSQQVVLVINGGFAPNHAGFSSKTLEYFLNTSFHNLDILRMIILKA